MKAMNIMGFLLITFIVGTVQTMEMPDVTGFSEEKALLVGEISVQDYLLGLAKSDPDYEVMIEAISAATDPLIYVRLIYEISSAKRILSVAQHDHLGFIKVKEGGYQDLRNYTKKQIKIAYEQLK